jgi:hypothetical protein
MEMPRDEKYDVEESMRPLDMDELRRDFEGSAQQRAEEAANEERSGDSDRGI